MARPKKQDVDQRRFERFHDQAKKAQVLGFTELVEAATFGLKMRMIVQEIGQQQVVAASKAPSKPAKKAAPTQPGEKRRRGRPKGSKNKPKGAQIPSTAQAPNTGDVQPAEVPVTVMQPPPPIPPAEGVAGQATGDLGVL